MSTDPELLTTQVPGRPLLAPPAGLDRLPDYDGGWLLTDERTPFLSYVQADPSVNWSDELESLHSESSRTHFLDRWSRGAIIDRLEHLPTQPTIADLGCSTGFLLEDLAERFPAAVLVGVDLVAGGLGEAHRLVPAARLLQADVCALPIRDGAVDAVVSANLLEHVPDDVSALREIGRVLRPGGRAVLVVPAGPSTYDYYDRFLGHERRYAPGELAAKCATVGLEPLDDIQIASLLYPVFWLVKQRNRMRYDHLHGDALKERVAADINKTQHSRVGDLTWRLERSLQRRGVKLPFGIRSLVLAQSPGTPG